jgi:hypothetical protein
VKYLLIPDERGLARYRSGELQVTSKPRGQFDWIRENLAGGLRRPQLTTHYTASTCDARRSRTKELRRAIWSSTAALAQPNCAWGAARLGWVPPGIDASAPSRLTTRTPRWRSVREGAAPVAPTAPPAQPLKLSCVTAGRCTKLALAIASMWKEALARR